MVNYAFDGHSVKVKLVGEPSELQDVTCTNDICAWNVNDQTVSGLQDCKQYELQAHFQECKNSKSITITVPPGKTNYLSMEEESGL